MSVTDSHPTVPSPDSSTRRGVLAAVGGTLAGAGVLGGVRERRERVTVARAASGDAMRERVPARWRAALRDATAARRRLAARYRDDPAVVDVGVGTRSERVGDLRRPVVVVHAAPDAGPPTVPDAVDGVEVRVRPADPDEFVDAAGVRDPAVDRRPHVPASVAGGERVASRKKFGTATCRVVDDAGTPHLLHAAHVFDACEDGRVGDPAIRDGATVGRVAHADPRLDYVAIAEPASGGAVTFADSVVCAGHVDGHVTEGGVARLMAAEERVATVGATSGWETGRVTEMRRSRAGCAGVGRGFLSTSLAIDQGDSGGPVFLAPEDEDGQPSSTSVVGLVSALGGVCSSAYSIHRDAGFRFG
jgi:S1-C subfamily serine protease